MPLRDLSQIVKIRRVKLRQRAAALFLAVFLPLITMAISPAAAENAVVSVRLGEHGTTTRFVIEMKEAADYELFTLSNPYRVVIDLPEMAFNVPDSLGQEGRGLISKFRFG